jgi:hypothetical protein
VRKVGEVEGKMAKLSAADALREAEKKEFTACGPATNRRGS